MDGGFTSIKKRLHPMRITEVTKKRKYALLQNLSPTKMTGKESKLKKLKI